jgi:nitrogen fixation NifU-like protein
MNKELVHFVENLQLRIMDETREAFGDRGFERWLKPKYRGAIRNPNGYGRIIGSCGDTMQIFLKFENDRVIDASYITDGCGSSNVCGSFAAEAAVHHQIICERCKYENVNRLFEQERKHP